MTLIEGIGDEVTQFFLAFFVVVLVSIAWCSTNTVDHRPFRTVVLLDRRRRRPIVRRLPPRRVLSQTEISSIQGVNLPPALHVVVTEEDTAANTTENNSESDTNSVVNPSLVENKPAEPGTSTEEEPRASTSESSITESEVHSIIRTMDAEDKNNDVQLRLGRLTHFENQGDRDQTDGAEPSAESISPQPVVDNDQPKDDTELRKRINATQASTSEPETTNRSKEGSTALTIKLKYINDDIKIVDGRSDELLGDFKRRHFQEEESANKVVKLIFNGHVLKQDNQTLHGCGLFDMCVVHCLVHPRRNTDSTQAQSGAGRESRSVNNDSPSTEYFTFRERLDGISNFNNNNQGIDWDLGNFLFALISFILLAAWYFRYVYAHLYTVTATVGLIFITGIFTIVLVGMCFPDNYESTPIPTIRIARTERIEVQEPQPATSAQS